MLPKELTSIDQTAGGKGLSWELKVAAQDHEKLYMQEIKEPLKAPLPAVASGRHTGQKRN